MAKSHAVLTLEKKMADLKADLAHLELLRKRTLAGLAHVEATLALLRDAKKRGAPSGYQRRWMFKRGELKRLIATVEREAAGSLTHRHREIARAIIARMGWDRDDRGLLRIMTEKVKAGRRDYSRPKSSFNFSAASSDGTRAKISTLSGSAHTARYRK